MKEFWTSLGASARIGVLGGVALILALTLASAWWLLHTDYQVLFADLKPQDTAAMVAELDRQKIPYRIGGDGNTILVDAQSVHATRLKLMGKDMPLHGPAGFELFNTADFGMTEFAQKINYQRALQGEITRTILSLAEVRDARVHLALPEEGLFKRANGKAKAAITLTLKAGQSLRAEQISGIQRLVSAAVPGVSMQDVTIVDQQGVALTRQVPAEGEHDLGSGRLDLKKETEQLLARKAGDVLDRIFGAGQAIASVDVTLNMDQVRTTTEDVLGAPGKSGQMTGVMVREREVMRDTAAPLDARADSARAGSAQREVEYQTGRRIEQVVSQPGTIRRLQVVAMVRKPLEGPQLEQVRALVAAAVGAVADRGDAVVVQSMKAFEVGTGATVVDAVPTLSTALTSQAPAVVRHQSGPETPVGWFVSAGLLLLLVLGLMFAWLVTRRPAARTPVPLTDAQRQAALRQVESWLEGTR